MRKIYRYELYHQSNVIEISNLLDDLHQVHVHVLKLQRRYYRMFGKYISAYTMNRHITKLKRRTKPQMHDKTDLIRHNSLRVER